LALAGWRAVHRSAQEIVIATDHEGDRILFFLSGVLELRRELALTWSIAGNMYTDPQLTVTHPRHPSESRRYRLNDYEHSSAGRAQFVADVRRDFGQ
jgi:hypothetical protein